MSNLFIDDQEYTLNSGPFEILIPELVLDPALEDDPETLEDGSKFIYEVYMEADEGAFVSLPIELGHFDAELIVLTIDSTDVLQVGVHVLRVKTIL